MEAEIIKHLSAKWSPEVILLGGSRALGEQVPGSDWDLFLIGNYSSRDSFPDQLHGNHLDILLRPKSELQDGVLRIYYGPVRLLKVLKDNDTELGAKIVHQTKLAYENGPSAKAAKDFQIDQLEMARVATKISSHSTDAEACFASLGQFHRMAIQYWFERRLRWSLPPHVALPIIRKEDPEFASILTDIAGRAPIGTKMRACSKIQQMLWGE